MIGWRRILSTHRLALALAFLVGLVYVSHHFFVSRGLASRGFEYYPVTIASNRDEGAMYGPRANAVLEGQLIAGDISVAENEKSPTALPMLNPIILGGFARVMGSLKSAFILSDFLFPALIFFVLYLLAMELTGGKPLALFFAAVFIFMPKIFLALPPITPSLFQAFKDAVFSDAANLSYFARFEYPKVTFLFFATAFYLVLRVLRRKEKNAVIFAGVAFGALFYTYLYDWVYFLIGLILVGAIFLCQRDYSQVKRLLEIIAVGLIVSVPYWINFLRLINLPHYNDLSARFGVELGRYLRLATAWKTYLRSAVLALLVWFLWRKRDRLTANFLLGFLPTIAIVLNLQLVLGFNPQPDHWHRVQFLTLGLSFLMLGLWLYERYCVTESRRRLFVITVGALMVLIFSSSLYSQYAFSAAEVSNFTIPQEHSLSYKWLNENTPQWSVVGGISSAMNGLPLYTHNKLFLPNGFNTTISDAEIWDRFMVTARIFGIGLQEFERLIKQPDTLLFLFHDEYRDRSFDSYFSASGRELPDLVAAEMKQKYVEYLGLPAGALAEKYRLDYIYFNEKAGEIGTDPVQILTSIKKVYDNQGIKIYQLHT